MYICSNCWNTSLKWTWQCSFCHEYWTMVEFKESKSKKWLNLQTKKELVKINDSISKESKDKIRTKSNELNTLLSWWFTVWSITLLSWEPGIWKSTLALQLADIIWCEMIYVSWEENEYQITQRAKRLGIKNNISLFCENNLENIIESIKDTKTDLIIIDSISVIFSNEASWTAWSIQQVKTVTEKIVEFWKQTNTTIIIIWHVTKDWNLAWPKTLEHLVDTVLFFEWERYEDIRILRSLKNRFWPTNEIAIFKMTENWLKDLINPWFEFISNENDNNTSGTSLSITMEWNRPILVEVESLTTYTKFGYPKRSSRWIPQQKLDLILAVIWKYSKINLDSYDVYINIVRWIKVDEPWIDLSIWASIISSKLWKPISRDTIFIWEISLTGKIKNCQNLEKRVKEAIKLWFKNIVVPNVEIKIEKEINFTKIKDILELVKYVG